MPSIYVIVYLSITIGIFGCLWILFSSVNGETFIKESINEQTGEPFTEDEQQKVLSYIISIAAVVSIFWPLALLVFSFMILVGRERLAKKLDEYTKDNSNE